MKRYMALMTDDLSYTRRCSVLFRVEEFEIVRHGHKLGAVEAYCVPFIYRRNDDQVVLSILLIDSPKDSKSLPSKEPLRKRNEEESNRIVYLKRDVQKVK